MDEDEIKNFVADVLANGSDADDDLFAQVASNQAESNAMERATTCRATRRDGRRCQSKIISSAGFCPMHDPGRVAEMRAARAKGGQQRALSARIDRLVPASLRPVLSSLYDALEEVHRGDLPAARATAMASIAGAIVRVYTAGTLEDRIAALETREETTA